LCYTGYIRNFHLSQGISHRLAKAFLLDYNMNVHHQVPGGKIQFFPIVCLTLIIFHSLHYLLLLHTLITSELTKHKLNSRVSSPAPVQADPNLPLSFAWSGSYPHQDCSEAELCPPSPGLGSSLCTSLATFHSSLLHCLSPYSSNSTLLALKWLSVGSLFSFILYLTWKH